MTRAAEWVQRVAEWRTSGMTSKEFCAGREYSAQNLLYWSSELRRRAVVPSQGVALARVIRRAPAAGVIVVRTKRARVEVLPNTDRATLALVFEALGIVVNS